MQAPILESIRKNLFEKRDRINEWLRATPLSKKEVFLGPSRHSHLVMRATYHHWFYTQTSEKKNP